MRRTRMIVESANKLRNSVYFRKAFLAWYVQPYHQ